MFASSLLWLRHPSKTDYNEKPPAPVGLFRNSSAPSEADYQERTSLASRKHSNCLHNMAQLPCTSRESISSCHCLRPRTQDPCNYACEKNCFRDQNEHFASPLSTIHIVEYGKRGWIPDNFAVEHRIYVGQTRLHSFWRESVIIGQIWYTL